MYVFDLWQRRGLLLLVPIIFLLPSSHTLLALPEYMIPVLLLYGIVAVRLQKAVGWPDIAAETALVSWTAMITGSSALLLFLPLQALRMSMLVRDSRWSRRWLGDSLPLIIPLVSLIGFFYSGIDRAIAVDLIGILVATEFCSLGMIWYDELRHREETARTEQLHASLASKEAVLSTLAHEIRTPLTVITTTAEIMQEGRTGALEPRQKDFLQSIISSARRMTAFSETILASIKVESAWFSVQLQPVDLRAIIKDVVKHMTPFLEEKGQNMRYTFPKLISRPLADRQWIHQVLVNLVHNASKHLNSGGSIIIALNENEQCVVVSVSDNGSGIRTAERIRVFEDYFQGDKYSESRLEGSGLGLAIVKRVVEKHNGTVYFSSVKDQGTTVSFTMPKRHEADEENY